MVWASSLRTFACLYSFHEQWRDAYAAKQPSIGRFRRLPAARAGALVHEDCVGA